MKILIIVLTLVLSDVIVGLGDVEAKRWTNGAIVSWHGFAALVAYVLVSAAWLVILRVNGGGLGKSAVLWGSTGAVMPMLIGRFGFGETVAPAAWLGVGLCVAGLALVSFSRG